MVNLSPTDFYSWLYYMYTPLPLLCVSWYKHACTIRSRAWDKSLECALMTDTVYETTETRAIALAAPGSVSCNPALQRSRLCTDKILKTNRHFLEMQVHYITQLVLFCDVVDPPGRRICWQNMDNIVSVFIYYPCEPGGTSLMTIRYHPYAIQWFIWLGWGLRLG